jgi:hypothetical protein
LKFFRLSVLAILLLGAIFAAAQQFKPVTTKTYEAPAFFAAFPDSSDNGVQFSTQATDHPQFGKVISNIYMASYDNGRVAYFVCYVDYPSAIDGTASGLDHAIDSGVKNADLKEGFKIVRRDSRLSNLYSRSADVTGDRKDGATVIYIRVAVSGKRLWQTFVIAVGRQVSAADGTAFLDSVRLR